jgi:hypothetical protein
VQLKSDLDVQQTHLSCEQFPEAGLLNKSLFLAPTLGVVTKFVIVTDMI